MILEYQENGNMIQLELKFLGLQLLLLVGLKVFLIDITNWTIGFLKKDHHHSGWLDSFIHKASWHQWNKKSQDKEKLRTGLLMKLSTALKFLKISFKEMTEELKEGQLMLHLKVFTFMVFSLKVLVGVDLKRSYKILTLKNFITSSQFFMCQLFQLLFLQVVLQELVKLQDKRQSKLRNFFINAQYTFIQEEMINIWYSKQVSKQNQLVLLKVQTKEWLQQWNGNYVVLVSCVVKSD